MPDANLYISPLTELKVKTYPSFVLTEEFLFPSKCRETGDLTLQTPPQSDFTWAVTRW